MSDFSPTALRRAGSRTLVHQVAIAGAGPTGLMLAAELALAGIDVVLIERRHNQELAGARAGGLHARTIELLDQRGLADRFLAAGTTAQVAGFAWMRLDISDFPTRHPYGLSLRQNHIERLLAERLAELPVTWLRGAELTTFSQDETGVEISLADGRRLHAQWLVGCDGGRSLVRKGAGIDFPGTEATVSHILAEVELAEEPEWGLKHTPHGIFSLARLEDGHTVGVMATEPPGRDGEPTLDELRQALRTGYGTDYGLRGASWLSRFSDAARQAASYRNGRVLLAGDAAHVHYPAGGQGLNLGVQDAVNLGWKLAQVVRGVSPQSLLDTYHAERHPVAARVLRTTLAQVVLLRPIDAHLEALRELIGQWLGMEEPRRAMAGMMSGLDICYDLGAGHPLLGRRMPDLELRTAAGPSRLFDWLHEARPLLLSRGPVPSAAGPWAGRVQCLEADLAGPLDVPVIGAVPAPPAVLVRPDGHVAWAGEGGSDRLVAALTHWFGPPAD